MQLAYRYGQDNTAKNNTHLPAWLAADRPTHDVTYVAPQKPLFSALEGQRIVLPDNVSVITQSLLASECQSWLGSVKDSAKNLGTLLDIRMDSDIEKMFKDALLVNNGKAAYSAFLAHVEKAVCNISQKIMAECEAAVTALPNGELLWLASKNEKLYGFNVTADNENEIHGLSFECCDFFQHFYANITNVPTQYRPHYAYLIDQLMSAGSGSWQIHAVQFYGSFDLCDTEEELKVVEAFVDSLDADNLEQVKLLIYNASGIVKEFLDSLVEIYLYGEDFEVALDDDPDTTLHFIKDGFKRLEFEVKSELLMRFDGDLSLKDIAELDHDNHPVAQLLSATANTLQSFFDASYGVKWKSVFEQKDETFPFGIVVSPLSIGEMSDSADELVSHVYEGFMQAAEDLDTLHINTEESGWLDIVISHCKATALLISLIAGIVKASD